MTEARNGRTWIPEAYLDEVTPPGRASPDAWIERGDDGKLWIAPAWSSERTSPRLPLEEGQVVGFYWCDEFGAVRVQFKDDGTFKPLGPVEPKATHFWGVGDPGSLADSLAAMAKTEAEHLKSTEDEYCLFDVQMATWADKAVQHRLVVERGAARFVQIAGVN